VSSLRADVAGGGSRKLGLGSSAAIVVATLAAFGVGGDLEAPGTRQRLFQAGLRAHRHVQPDGSGVDVAASAFGGVLRCVLSASGLSTEALSFPAPVSAFAFPAPASTKDMVARVRAFARTSPKEHERVMGRAGDAAARAARAMTEAELLGALRDQGAALRELGVLSGVPIFTPEIDLLARVAEAEGAFFGPSGAGGGDIGIRVGSAPMGAAFAAGLEQLGVDPLRLTIGAPGVALQR
jgi:phosphomevalonate kinase